MISSIALNTGLLETIAGFILAALTNLLMANAERRPPEVILRVNNAVLAGVTACAVCDIMVQYGLFSTRLVPPFCALIGLMADAKIYKILASSWLGSFAAKHGFTVPDKFKGIVKNSNTGGPKDEP